MALAMNSWRLGEVEDEALDTRVGAGQVPQLAHEVRVLEEADVEDDVGVDGHAVLEAEGDEARHHAGRAARGRPELGDDAAAQLVDREVGRVDDARRARAERSEALALDADAVEDGEARRRRRC